jgi:hypothetical protein
MDCLKRSLISAKSWVWDDDDAREREGKDQVLSFSGRRHARCRGRFWDREPASPVVRFSICIGRCDFVHLCHFEQFLLEQGMDVSRFAFQTLDAATYAIRNCERGGISHTDPDITVFGTRGNPVISNAPSEPLNPTARCDGRKPDFGDSSVHRPVLEFLCQPILDI